jgi:hypothetical protein
MMSANTQESKMAPLFYYAKIDLEKWYYNTRCGATPDDYLLAAVPMQEETLKVMTTWKTLVLGLDDKEGPWTSLDGPDLSGAFLVIQQRRGTQRRIVFATRAGEIPEGGDLPPLPGILLSAADMPATAFHMHVGVNGKWSPDTEDLKPTAHVHGYRMGDVQASYLFWVLDVSSIPANQKLHVEWVLWYKHPTAGTLWFRQMGQNFVAELPALS